MSQYSSRIHIKVKNTDVWKKFKDKDDAEFDLFSLSETNQTSLILKGNPQLYWGKEKTYSYDESNKKHQTKDDIIFEVDSYKY